jgi:hypothetical protein
MHCVNLFQGKDFIYCTIFASQDLPVFITEKCEADEFYTKYIGQPKFGVSNVQFLNLVIRWLYKARFITE